MLVGGGLYSTQLQPVSTREFNKKSEGIKCEESDVEKLMRLSFSADGDTLLMFREITGLRLVP